MSQHEIKSRTDRLISILSVLAFFALMGLAQHQDAKDDAAARASEQGREVVAK
jgi:hypothetical protein